MSEAKEKDTQIIDSERVTVQDIPDALEDIEVKNPRIGRVLKLQEEAERQNELEKLRSRRIRQQQEYIDKMINSVEQNLKNTREEAAYNEAFEQQIKEQVYRDARHQRGQARGNDGGETFLVSGCGICAVFPVLSHDRTVRGIAWIWFGNLYFYGVFYGDRGNIAVERKEAV